MMCPPPCVCVPHVALAFLPLLCVPWCLSCHVSWFQTVDMLSLVFCRFSCSHKNSVWTTQTAHSCSVLRQRRVVLLSCLLAVSATCWRVVVREC